MHIVDRRLNPGSKSLENRQRFLRRAKARVQGAVKKSSQDRDIRDVLEGGEVSIPLDGMNEPRFRREGGTRDMVLPGNKKFVEGDVLCGRATLSGTHALASRNAVDLVAYRTLPCSDKTNAHGALARVAKREPVAIFDAPQRFARSSMTARLISDFSTSGLKSL